MGALSVDGFSLALPNAPVRNVMRFHLVYSGPLSASGNKGKAAEAAAIRGKLSSQLKQLWSTHHAPDIVG